MSKPMWICGAMIALALVLLTVTGNPAALLPVIGCALMMGMMMFMMAGHGRSGDKNG